MSEAADVGHRPSAIVARIANTNSTNKKQQQTVIRTYTSTCFSPISEGREEMRKAQLRRASNVGGAAILGQPQGIAKKAAETGPAAAEEFAPTLQGFEPLR